MVDGFDGVTEIDTSGGVTTTWVDALMLPTDAVIVDVPVARALTVPALPDALLTAATEVDEEFHVTPSSVPRELPKASCPVARIRSVFPTASGTFCGLRVIDARFGRERLDG